MYLHQNNLTENRIAAHELGVDGVRSLELYNKTEIKASEFELARDRFISAQVSSSHQIEVFIDSISRHPYFCSNGGGVQVRHFLHRFLIHKWTFKNTLFMVFVSKLKGILQSSKWSSKGKR